MKMGRKHTSTELVDSLWVDNLSLVHRRKLEELPNTGIEYPFLITNPYFDPVYDDYEKLYT